MCTAAGHCCSFIVLNIADLICDNSYHCEEIACGWKLSHHNHLTFPSTERKSVSSCCNETHFLFLIQDYNLTTPAIYVHVWARIKRFYTNKQTHKTSCHVVALFSSNRNELNQQTVRSTTGPLSEGTHTFHIRTHLLKVVKTSLNKNLFKWTRHQHKAERK